jgi:CheY-like chemotaxis protein
VAETVAGRATPTARTEGAVLLVDADPNVAELLTTTLVVQGFQVYTTADGRAAVEHARPIAIGWMANRFLPPSAASFRDSALAWRRTRDAPHDTAQPVQRTRGLNARRKQR